MQGKTFDQYAGVGIRRSLDPHTATGYDARVRLGIYRTGRAGRNDTQKPPHPKAAVEPRRPTQGAENRQVIYPKDEQDKERHEDSEESSKALRQAPSSLFHRL